MKPIFNIRLSITLLTVLFFTSGAVAQNTSQPAAAQGNFMIGITGGCSIPIGNFTKTDYYNPASGFAGIGGNMGITAMWHLNKHWGIAEQFSYQKFSFAGGQNMAHGMQSFPGGFDVDSVTFNVRGDNHTFNLLAGPVYTFEAAKKLAIDVRLLVGFVDANLAGNNVTLTDGGVTDPTFYQAVSRAASFGGQLGAALRYKVTPHISIMANVDYFYSEPNFEVDNINRNNTAGREIFSYKQPIEGINANVSLMYQVR